MSETGIQNAVELIQSLNPRRRSSQTPEPFVMILRLSLTRWLRASSRLRNSTLWSV